MNASVTLQKCCILTYTPEGTDSSKQNGLRKFPQKRGKEYDFSGLWENFEGKEEVFFEGVGVS